MYKRRWVFDLGGDGGAGASALGENEGEGGWTTTREVRFGVGSAVAVVAAVVAAAVAAAALAAVCMHLPFFLVPRPVLVLVSDSAALEPAEGPFLGLGLV